MPRVVQRSKGLERILALPRRTWPPELAEEAARRLTAELKTPAGTMTLRPIQAAALCELRAVGGIFCPIRVGAGKTLISFLAATVLAAARVVIVVPANLREKTERDLKIARRHWQISPAIRIESYETLGRAQHADKLKEWDPDLMVLDEAHRAKNPKAAVTRRILRALLRGRCQLVVMSGTVTRRSLRDYAHLLTLSLGEDSTPVPTTWGELDAWADALDETKGDTRTTEVGALSMLRGPEEADIDDPLMACRRAFRRRLVDTPGVVATDESQLGVSLSITRVRPPVPRAVEAALRKLRGDWELPDGTPIADGVSVWRHAREIALGFFYIWDPAPPQPWLEARRAWCSVCREILSNNRTNLDSEFQVVQAIDAGDPRAPKAKLVDGPCTCAELAAQWEEEHGPPSCSHCEQAPTCPVCKAKARTAGETRTQSRITPEMRALGLGPLARWRAIKDSFKPNTVPVWLDSFAVDYVIGRAKHEPILVWVEHRAFAAALAARGLPYYGAQGRCGRVAVEDADPSKSAALSIASNATGRNLQAWSKNLITSLPPSGSTCEQLLGRTHRDGQLADEVEAWWLSTCAEHDEAMDQAVQDCGYVESTTGQPQKLLYASRT